MGEDSFQIKMKETGEAEVIPYSALFFSLVKDLLKPGEFLCWETTIHSQFVMVAADLISHVMPDVLRGKMESISTMWWLASGNMESAQTSCRTTGLP